MIVNVSLRELLAERGLRRVVRLGHVAIMPQPGPEGALRGSRGPRGL